MTPTEADAAFAQAIELQQSGQLDPARALYEQILAAFPAYLHVPHLLGVIVSQQGDWFLARRLIETSLQLQASDPDALANLAWVLVNLGLHDKALARCDQAIALSPGHARAHLTRGMALRMAGQFEPAIAAFEQALALKPDLYEALNYRGQCLHRLGQYAQALATYDLALQCEPGNADVWNNRGSSLTLLDRHDEGAASFLQALQLQPAFPEALFNHGLALQQARRFDEALARYEQALRLRPQYPEALVHRAFALQALRRSTHDSLASLDRALHLRPGYFEALNGRANVLGQMEQYAEALENYQAVLRIKPDFHEALINQGHALRELGRLDEAADSYREALRCGGDAQAGLFALAAMGREAAPPVAPADYIVSLFDGYADRFDDHLVGKLQYQAHERLCEALLPLAGPGPHDILDLGCGTGLCAPLLQPVTRSLVGVDLSPGMLDAARPRGLYSQLLCRDVTEFLQDQDQVFDLVVSTDVFIYIGDLQPVFAGVRRGLRGAGLFGFSIEACEEQDFELRPTRRYAQSPAYIRRLAEQHGFEVLHLAPSVIRKENGVDTAGYIAVLKAH
ncbi:MAG: tetratricopeptide repeat protein [Ramlibacter sp.]|nr:tetratricopeptide repeat protein [Ramlibacter sp.]